MFSDGLKGLFDINSFRLENAKLPVDYIKDVRISPSDPTVLSMYNFQIAGKHAGLYALSPISVRVGSQEYKSTMTSYSVLAGSLAKQAISSSPQQSIPSSVNVQQSTAAPPEKPQTVLRLDAGVEGKTSLYPGQRTKLVYTYSFEGDISLTTEKLPLLDAEGFIKIGEKEITDSSKGNVSIRTISQVVEAVKPGKYTFGPSLAEGYTYENDSGGNPVYTSSKLRTEAPDIQLTVLPFPEQNKPLSFNGAVGLFTFETKLVGPSKLEVGDEISLSIVVVGKGNLKTMTLSDLCCQPGFSGFFKISDLPPTEEVTDTSKTSVIKLRLLTDLIKAIPSVEFAFFDPELSRYVDLHSKAIPITVTNMTPASIAVPAETAQRIKVSGKTEKASYSIAPIEIGSIISLETSDLYNKIFGTWWTFLIIPIAIALLLFQRIIREYLVWQLNNIKQENSHELYANAFMKKNTCDFEMLKQALKLALVETGKLESVLIEDNDLPEEGLCDDVKAFSSMLDERRFSGRESINLKDVQKQSKALIEKIWNSRGAK